MSTPITISFQHTYTNGRGERIIADFELDDSKADLFRSIVSRAIADAESYGWERPGTARAIGGAFRVEVRKAGAL